MVKISKPFEPLNIKVMIESGVVCRSFVQLSDKCAFIFFLEKWPIFSIKPMNMGPGLYIIEVYRLPHVLMYFPIRYVALKVLKNPSEKYR